MPKVQNWIAEHIESRILRGKQWREKLPEHARLAKDFRYVRILGNGFRPVSISVINPCGHLKDIDGRQIKKCNGLAEAMERAKSANRKEYTPGAGKPEHRVQASLIREALLGGLRLHQAFQGFDHEFDELIFVMDELSLEAGENKLRADMIAVGHKNGTYFPVFIELKNSRQLTTLKRQLNKANEMLWENEEARSMFAKFLNAVAGVNVDTAAEAKRMIIWPKAPSGNESESVKQTRREGFLIADFEPSSSSERSYVFRTLR
ncbi:MAG TPA: hypothetical protein VFC39_10720 [Acidobacteriaceae bacterium]|nr:hypothetical protein [Acidobacteriaceae bacterium]